MTYEIESNRFKVFFSKYINWWLWHSNKGEKENKDNTEIILGHIKSWHISRNSAKSFKTTSYNPMRLF